MAQLDSPPELGKRRPAAPRTKSKKELLALALRQADVDRNEEDPYAALKDDRPEGAKATLRHETSRKIIMFKYADNGRVQRKEVPSANLQMLMENGWLWECPDCGTDCYDDPNACPRRDPVKYRECPVCFKKFHDYGVTKANTEDTDDDVNRIMDVSTPKNSPSTPESRTLQALNMHIAAYHPEEAASRGLSQLVMQIQGGR